MVYNQAVARQGLVERAHLLAVFEDEILAGDGGVDAIRGGIGGGTGHVADGGGGFQGDGVDPAVLDFLPHVETGGAVAVVAAPGAVAHDVPDAGTGEVAAGEFVVGIVKVGGAEVVAEFVANHADGAHFAGAEHFRFDGVAAHFDAIERQAVDFGGVRPNIVACAGHLLAVALVDDGQAVEHAVAIVVEFREVDVFIDVFQRFGNHGHRAVRAVEFRRTVEVDPRSDSYFDVQLAVALFQIVVAERADARPVLLVHHILELLLSVFGRGVLIIEQKEQQFTFALGGE